MAKFGENSGEKRQAAVARMKKQFLISEPQCKTCQSEHRPSIDKLLMLGTAYAEISRAFGISASSIGSHARDHLNVEDAAIQRIAEREAALAEQSIEDGVHGFTKRRLYLEAALEKGMQSLINGEVRVSPRDMAGLIELAEKLDQKIYGATAEEIMTQFNALVQAMREILSPEQNFAITVRTKELLNQAPAGLNP